MALKFVITLVHIKRLLRNPDESGFLAMTPFTVIASPDLSGRSSLITVILVLTGHSSIKEKNNKTSNQHKERYIYV